MTIAANYKSLPRIVVAWIALLVIFIGNRCAAAPNASFTFNPTNGCAPLNVQFTNSSTGAVSYYWDLGNGNTSTLNNPSNIYTIAGSYTIRLIAYDAFGQSDTFTVINGVVVVAKPVSGFNSNIQAACVDDNLISFSNTSVGGNTYLWDFGDGTTSTQSTPLHQYNTSGTFTVTLLTTNAAGCQDLFTRNLYITIHPRPSGLVTTNALASCDPSTPFSFGISNTNAILFNWNFGDGSGSNLQNTSHTYSLPGTYQVYCVLTSPLGCTDTVTLNDPIVIRANNWAYFTVDDDSGCAPFTVQFNNPFNAQTLWDFGDGTTAPQSSPSHTYTTPGDYTVSLILYMQSGCVDTVVYPNMIHVGVMPIVNFTISDTLGCAPHQVQFINLSSNYSTCQWNFGNGGSSQSINPTTTYNSTGNFTVTLHVTSADGCIRHKTLVNSITVSSPRVLFGATPRVGCAPLNVNFSSNCFGNGLSYFWDFGDGNTSTLANPSHQYTVNGTYDVSLIIVDSLGCSDTLDRSTYVQLINPSANYIPPPTTAGCAPLTTQFTDNTLGATSWLWDFGDGTTSNLQNPLHTYSIPGYYTVSLTTETSGGGCSQYIPIFSTFQVFGGYAGFTDSVTDCPPFVAQFYDTSSNAISWLWDFGDGTTSTLQNPSHSYPVGGYHSVSLTITTTDGCSYTTMQSNGVYFPPFGANFYGLPLDTVFPADVQFYANSVGATQWLWSFGDGDSSSLENPIHTYNMFGNYDVTLTIINDLCTLTYNPPPFNFGTPDTTPIDPGNVGIVEVQEGCAPLTVTFNNAALIQGAIQWMWEFGDGDTSTLQYPVHTYLFRGIYNVKLTTLDTLGITSVWNWDSLVRVGGPVADFSFTQNSSCTNTTINLQNLSTGGSSYFWNFGDSTTATTFNASHTYNGGLPNYIVTLTVFDTVGCQQSLSTSIFANYISPVLASETEVCGYDSVHFSTSLQNYTSYLWLFGDGDSSTQINPVHLYDSEGVYSVSLTVIDAAGCAQTFNLQPNVTVWQPIANFSTWSSRQACDLLRVDFANYSLNGDAYFWDFGDGATSTYFGPSHVYDQAGLYTVTLQVYRGSCVDVLQEINYIKIDTAHAEFSFTNTGICMPSTAVFTDLSANPVSWSWDFGDNQYDTTQHPTHIYAEFVGYPIQLAIVDQNGCRDTFELPFPELLVAKFDALNTEGCTPHTVTFVDQSHYANSWYWDFGDGTTSTSASPSHTYTQPGTYNVMLVVNAGPQHGFCTDTLIRVTPIIIRNPIADFVTTDTMQCAPAVVEFTNLTLDGDSYIWDFGDSSTSTNQQTNHIYADPGIYTVSLIVNTTQGCTDTITKEMYINVLGPNTNFSISDFEGCTPFTVSFTDLSQQAINWSWSFGDGNSSSTQNATHTYTDTGSFTIALVTTDTNGCSAFFEYPQEVLVHPTPEAGFQISDTIGCEPVHVSFTNTSIGFDSIYWNFGNGLSSTALFPTTVYDTAGVYYPSITAMNIYGCSDTSYSTQQIIVNDVPSALFTAGTQQGCAPLAVSFIDQSSSAIQANYLWLFSNGITDTAQNPQIIFSNPGFYDATLIISNASGCADTISLPNYIHVLDTLPPLATPILSVSVLDNYAVEITWDNNPAIDLSYYALYKLSGNSYQLIYSDTNPNNTQFGVFPSYIDSGLNTLHNVYTYILSTGDVCSNIIPLTELTPHSTINVTSARSGNFINVTWNAYDGCPVSAYDIFRRDPYNTNWQYLSSVPSDTLHYLDTAFSCPWEYSYRIQARDLCGNVFTSWSDTSITYPVNLLDNQIADVVRSTVVDNHHVLTEWLEPLVHPEAIVQYDLYRSLDNSNFYYVASLPVNQTYFHDYDVDVQTQHYYYKILVKNICNVNGDLSTNTSTIILNGTMDEQRSVQLNWTPYNGWTDGVDYYIIEFKDADNQWQLLKKVSGTDLHYNYIED